MDKICISNNHLIVISILIIILLIYFILFFNEKNKKYLKKLYKINKESIEDKNNKESIEDKNKLNDDIQYNNNNTIDNIMKFNMIRDNLVLKDKLYPPLNRYPL